MIIKETHIHTYTLTHTHTLHMHTRSSFYATVVIWWIFYGLLIVEELEKLQKESRKDILTLEGKDILLSLVNGSHVLCLVVLRWEILM